jgi:hypothetical protein
MVERGQGLSTNRINAWDSSPHWKTMVAKKNKTLYFTRGNYVLYGSKQHILTLCNHIGSIEDITWAPWRIWWRPLRNRHYYTKILDVSCWRPTLFHDVTKYCRSYDACQRVGGLTIQSLVKLVIILLEEPFMKWGLDLLYWLNMWDGLQVTNTLL